jgi:hypothetical protein
MLSKVIFVIAVTSLAAVALRYFIAEDDEANLEREVSGQLDALREHLFRR